MKHIAQRARLKNQPRGREGLPCGGIGQARALPSFAPSVPPLARALAACSLLTLAPHLAQSQSAIPANTLPSGLLVAAGQAQAAVNGNRMTVVNTPQAVLNWNSFSVGAGSAVHFQQANASSAVLNRVTGQDPSSILGSLSSNGRVWLLNPNGVLFGHSARVDVAGLVASTLRLNDTDWLAGRYSLSAGNPGAVVLNQGQLRSSFGGTIALLGAGVQNEGSLHTDGGQIILAAGKSIELVDTGAPHLGVRISADAGAARNLGSLQAAGGRVDIHAAAVNQSGIVSADGFGTGPGGEVWIKATGAIDAAAGSSTRADGSRGGQVHIESTTGRSSLQGGISAKGMADGGGQVTLLGREVGLLDTASVDASGASAGGAVVVGGGLGGKDPRYANAQAVYFGPQARISADALREGAGGSIVLWSDRATRAFGSLSVRGGALGGNGGFVETSGGWLDARPARVDTGAPRGASGAWLLDPYDILISDFVSDANVNAAFTATGNSATISTSTLATALGSGTNVTVYTGGVGGGEAGNILMSSATLSVVPGSGVTSLGNLTLRADNNIDINASSIQSASLPMSVTLTAGATSGNPGTINVSNSTIDTAGDGMGTGRAIVLTGIATGNTPGGTSFAGAAGGVTLSDSTLNAGRGTVNVYGAPTVNTAPGVDVNNTDIQASNIDLKGSATLQGVHLRGTSTLQAQQSLSVHGLSSAQPGVLVTDNATVRVLPGALPAGSLFIDGRSTANTFNISGLRIDAASATRSTVVANAGSSVTLQGSAAGNRWGVEVDATLAVPVVDATGAGNVVLRGLRGPSNGVGVFVDAARIVGGLSTTIGGLYLYLYGSSEVNAAGPVRLQADYVFLNTGAVISSSATGDAIVLSEQGSQGLRAFSNESGSNALSAPNGRWIVFAQTSDPADWQPRLLNSTYDFSRFGAGYGAWAGDAGNGYVFAETRTASFSVDVNTKVYDGSPVAMVSNVSVTPASGDTATVSPNPSVTYANANVQNNKPATFSNTAVSFSDSLGKPVYGYALSGSAQGNITPRLVYGTLTVQAREYDASADAYITVSGLSGLVGSETLTASGLGQFGDKNVGANKLVSGAAVVLGNGSGGGLASNYAYFVDSQSLYGAITPRAMPVSGLVANNKVYDGTSVALVTGVPVLGVSALGSDAVTVQGQPLAWFSDKNVGSGKLVTVSGLSLGGADAGNYALSLPSALRASITPRPVDVSGLNVVTKVYDGTTSATLLGTPAASAIAGDSVSFSGSPSAVFADKHVGANKPVTLTGLSLVGADAANYTVTSSAGVTGSITPLTLPVLGLTAQSRVYDGSTVATLVGGARVATLAGDAVALTGGGSAAFEDKNVGTGKAVTVSAYTLTGADARNYLLTQPQGLRADITTRVASVSGLTAQSRVYDTTNQVTLQGTAVVNTLAGDAASLSGVASARLADKNAGQAKAVTVTGLELTGADARNYTLLQPQGLRVDITPLELALQGLQALSRPYNAGQAAELSGTARVDTLAGDLVNLTGSAQAGFDDKNAGLAKEVRVSGLSLAGPDAPNYRLMPPTGLKADITPLGVTVTDVSAAGRVYDGSTQALLAGNARVQPLAGDDLAVTGVPQARFSDKQVGVDKPVEVIGFTLSGRDAANYSLTQPQGLRASITPRVLSLEGLAAQNKVYDSTTSVGLSGAAQVTAVQGDALSVVGTAVGSFSDADVGTQKPVSVSGLVLAGADRDNYVLSANSGLTAAISPAPLQYVAKVEVRGLGQPLDGLNGSVSGFVGNDTQATATQGSLQFRTTASAGSPPGAYAVQGSGLVARNYSLSQAPGNATALNIVDLTPSVAAAAVVASPVLPQISVQTAPVVGLPTSAAANVSLINFSGVQPPGPARAALVLPSAPAGAAPSPAAVSAAVPATTTATAAAGLTAGATAASGAVPEHSAAAAPAAAPAPAPTPAPAPAPAAPAAPEAPPSSDRAAPATSFGAVRLAGLSAGEIQGLLNGRRLFMQNLLSNSSQKLQLNPGLADLRECESAADASSGSCLITARLKDRLARVQAAAPAEAVPAQPSTPPTANLALAPALASPAQQDNLAPVGTVAANALAALVSPPRLPALGAQRRAVRSAALPQIERKIALLVGVDNYQDPAIPTLANAVKDARALAQVFENQMGYETVVLPNATRATLVAALNQLALTVGPRDSVVVYYAGHGEVVPTTQLGYWLLADSTAQRPETWLSNTDISRLVGQMGASQVALVSDSCYSGSLASEERIRGVPNNLDPKKVLDKRSVVVMSSGGNEPVFDDSKNGHSPFAWSLMETLGGVSNWKAGSHVFERVRFAVARTLPQRPQYSASLAAGHQPGGDYLFEQRQLQSLP